LRWRRKDRQNGSDQACPKVYDEFEVGVRVSVRLAVEADIAHLETWQGFDTPAHRRALRYYLAMQDAGAGALIVAEVGGYPVAQLFLWFHRDDPTLAAGTNTVRLSPPLVITREDAQTAVSILDEALAEVSNS